MSVGIENDRYKITKNEDKLILTDKKTQKARILEPNDIDYVIDDNQKIRDSSVIENYFRLKDDKSELRFNTKKADYVSEYKEAEKYTNKKYQDSVEDFLSKWNFSKEELDNLASVPDESTIRKFETRTDEEKKSIANDFRLMKKTLLEERKITTDPFTYLKAYFKNYVSVEEMESLAKLKIDDYLHNRAFYSNDYEYDKIKSLEVKSLKDLKDNKVDYFGHINLDLLDNFSKRMKVIKDNAKEILEIDDNPEAKNINFKYNIGIITNPEDLDIYKKEKKRRETKEVKVETPIKPIMKEEIKPIEPSLIDIDKLSKVEPIPIDDDNLEPPKVNFEDVSKDNTKAWATWKLDPEVEKYYDSVPDNLEGVLKYYDYFKQNIIPIILQNNSKFSSQDPPKALQVLMSERIDASAVKTKDIIDKIKTLLTYVPPETQLEFIKSSKGFVGGKDGIVSDKITAYMIIENKIIHGIEKNISSLMRKYSHDEYTAKEFIDEIAENGIEAFSDPIRIHVVDKICKNYRGLEPYLFFINVY